MGDEFDDVYDRFDVGGILRDLQISKIVASVGINSDGEIEVKVGKGEGRFVSEVRASTIDEAMLRLREQVCRLYPKSRFARVLLTTEPSFGFNYTPGSPDAIAIVGCICPPDQIEDDEEVYNISSKCPAHGWTAMWRLHRRRGF
jgi:hypothetical protein